LTGRGGAPLLAIGSIGVFLSAGIFAANVLRSAAAGRKPHAAAIRP
jgi:hypothetical protein